MDGPTRFIQVTNDNSLVKYASNNSWTGMSKTEPIFQHGNMGAPVSSFLKTFNGGMMNDAISFTFEGKHILGLSENQIRSHMSHFHFLVGIT